MEPLNEVFRTMPFTRQQAAFMDYFRMEAGTLHVEQPDCTPIPVVSGEHESHILRLERDFRIFPAAFAY